MVAALPDGGYVCTAFPADDSARDTFLSGLIGFAVSWPVAIVIANCFGLSTSTDDAQVRRAARGSSVVSLCRLLLCAARLAYQRRFRIAMSQLHGRTRWLNWSMQQRLLLGRLDWRFQAPGAPRAGRLGRFKRFLASWWCTNYWVDGMVALSDALWACGGAAARRAAAAEPPDADGLDMAAELHFGAVTTRFKHAGFVVLYLCWGIFAWIMFACASRRARAACAARHVLADSLLASQTAASCTTCSA